MDKKNKFNRDNEYEQKIKKQNAKKRNIGNALI